MTSSMKDLLSLAAFGLALMIIPDARAQVGPYAGEQQRDIKALDAGSVAALRQGEWMGFAKAAELNGYPGQMHALELAEPLQLSPQQLAATRRLMDGHKARARELGRAVVEAESALDKLFADRQATPERVDEATQKIAALQGRLRAEHLNTHLAQTALMSSAQALRYAELRGYTGGAPAEPAARGSQHKHRH